MLQRMYYGSFVLVAIFPLFALLLGLVCRNCRVVVAVWIGPDTPIFVCG